MSKKKKKRKLKEAVLVFSIIQSVVTTICMIYEACLLYTSPSPRDS